MKKLFLIFALLLWSASDVEAQYIERANCASYPTPITNGTTCKQTTTVGGRTAGRLYNWNGSAWVDIDSGGGSVSSVGAVGTANQITVTGTNPNVSTGSWTFSIPTNPTLPGTTTGTFSGNLTGNVTGNTSGSSGSTTGNAATATALAANGANCSAGNYPLGVNASGAVENCTAVGVGDALIANPLSQFAATTSALLAGVITNETGTGLAVFNDTPTLIAPILGTPTSGVATNLTGLNATQLTTGTVPDARFPATLPAASGVNLTALNASNLASGTVSAARLPAKSAQVSVFDPTVAVTTGDGLAYFVIPPSMNGFNLVGVRAHVNTVSSSGVVTIDIARCALVATGDTCSGTVVAPLSTKLTIDANESKSSTAAVAAVIDTANDDVATDQVYRLDVDTAGTGTLGLIMLMEFALP